MLKFLGDTALAASFPSDFLPRKQQYIPARGERKRTAVASGSPPAAILIETRQLRRAAERRKSKALRAEYVKAGKRTARRHLLDRQARREREGFYDDQPSAAAALANRRCGRLQRQRKDDTGKARGSNLRGWR